MRGWSSKARSPVVMNPKQAVRRGIGFITVMVATLASRSAAHAQSLPAECAGAPGRAIAELLGDHKTAPTPDTQGEVVLAILETAARLSPRDINTRRDAETQALARLWRADSMYVKDQLIALLTDVAPLRDALDPVAADIIWQYHALSGDPRALFGPAVRHFRAYEVGMIVALDAIRAPVDETVEQVIFAYSCMSAWMLAKYAGDSLMSSDQFYIWPYSVSSSAELLSRARKFLTDEHRRVLRKYLTSAHVDGVEQYLGEP